MNLYVLKIRPSSRLVTETKLTREGIWMEGFDPSDSAYEMCVDVFYTSEGDGFILNGGKERSILVGEEFHREMLRKYSSEELLKGVEIDSLLSIINPLSLDKDVLFEEEVRDIASKIVDETDYINSKEDLFNLICKEISALKDKFKIQPK